MAGWPKIFQTKERDTGGSYETVNTIDGKDALRYTEESDEGSGRSVDEEKAALIDPLSSLDELKESRFRSKPLLLISTCLFGCSLFLYAFMYYRAPSDAACERKMWAFSPMMDVMEYEWRQYDSDLIPKEYFGEPTDERRAVWELIYDEGNIVFPYEKLAVINKSAEDYNWWRLPPPNDDQVIAFPEMTHQMHCVAFLWLFAYREYWDYRTLINTTELVFELHVNHCYLTLLTMMKCEADVTPVLFQSDTSGLGDWKTRDAPHRCKNFDKLAEWEREHKVCRSNCMREDFLQSMRQSEAMVSICLEGTKKTVADGSSLQYHTFMQMR